MERLQPIEWRLLTNREAATPEAVVELIDWYRARWEIEVTEQQSMAVRHAAWYAKENPIFSDTIALVRRSIWGTQIYDGSKNQHDTVKIPRALFDRLTETVSYAV